MGTRLQTSFAALYLLLERPLGARRVVAGVLIIHTLLLGYSAYVHSPTLNEPAHLVAGLSYWKFGRFDIYNVNPPLVRMVAALPVMAAGYKEDWNGFFEGPGVRPEMELGEDFVAANGERSYFLFMIARWACIPFSWLGAVVCFLWARDLYGRPAGVIAASIWCFEPNILAHASLITTDAHATALGLAACYTFWRWLKQPSWRQAASTGVVLGLAELAKTTLIVFYPLWLVMWIVYRWPVREHAPWVREAGMLSLRMAMGLCVLNFGYGFEGSFTRLRNFHFVSDLFTARGSRVESQGWGSPLRKAKSPKSGPACINRFANTWLGNVPVPFPENYLLGIDIQQKDFEHYSRPSYLRGVWQDHGWWYYYLYACAIKIPLGLWALGMIVIITRLYRNRVNKHLGLPFRNDKIWGHHGSASSIGVRPVVSPIYDELTLVLPTLVIFAIVSCKTGLNEHSRYVLPAFSYVYVAVSQIWQSQATFLTESRHAVNYGLSYMHRKSHLLVLFQTPMTTVFGIWFIVSSLWIYPHSLSYFNETIGGPRNGSRHLLGSNFDWGQDLRYLAKLMSNRSEVVDCVCLPGVPHSIRELIFAEQQRFCRRPTIDLKVIATSAAYLREVSTLRHNESESIDACCDGVNLGRGDYVPITYSIGLLFPRDQSIDNWRKLKDSSLSH